MSIQKIVSQEVDVRDGVTYVNTRCPREFLTEAMIQSAVDWARLHVGDTVSVRTFNHEKTQVLYFAAFLVAGKAAELRRVENFNGDSKTDEVFSYTLMQIQPWTATPFGDAVDAEAKKSKKAA